MLNSCAIIDKDGYVVGVEDEKSLFCLTVEEEFFCGISDGGIIPQKSREYAKKLGSELVYLRNVIPLKTSEPERIQDALNREKKVRLEFKNSCVVTIPGNINDFNQDRITFYLKEPFQYDIIESPL